MSTEAKRGGKRVARLNARKRHGQLGGDDVRHDSSRLLVAIALRTIRPRLDAAAHELLTLADAGIGGPPEVLLAITSLLDRMNLGLGEVIKDLSGLERQWDRYLSRAPMPAVPLLAEAV